MGRLPETNATRPEDSALKQAVTQVFRDGVAVLRGAFDPDLVERLRSSLMDRVVPHGDSGRYPYRVASLGERRTHYTLEIHRTFNTPEFYANPFVYQLAQLLLDNEFVLGSAAAAVSRPGAPPQYVHRDHPVLYSNRKLNAILPPASLTVSIPLVSTDQVTGGTEFQPGSHHLSSYDKRDFVRADSGPGDCIVWDSRCSHRGCANQGDDPRPIVLLYYQRPWFFNYVNYQRDAEIKITDRSFEAVPANLTHLFGWTGELFQRPRFEPRADGGCSCGSGLSYDECHRQP